MVLQTCSLNMIFLWPAVSRYSIPWSFLTEEFRDGAATLIIMTSMLFLVLMGRSLMKHAWSSTSTRILLNPDFMMAFPTACLDRPAYKPKLVVRDSTTKVREVSEEIKNKGHMFNEDK